MPATMTLMDDATGNQRYRCSHCSEIMETWQAVVHLLDCAGCGEPQCFRSAYDCPDCGSCNCDECRYPEDPYDYGEEEYGYPGLYNYGFKPEPVWYGGEDAPFHIGFELEITAPDRDTSAVYEWANSSKETCGLLYCKEDSSVAGFEIVSHPMTPDYFHSVDWEGFMASLNAAYPTGRAPDAQNSENRGHGLHVHVSRRAFQRRSQLARWCYLFNRNSDVVQRVARRTNSNWARFSTFPVSAVLPGNIWLANPTARQRYYEKEEAEGYNAAQEWLLRMQKYAQLNRKGEYLGHSSAFNIEPSHTVEIRANRSTRKADEFVRSIDLVIATALYTVSMQPCHETARAVSWESFCDWLSRHDYFRKHLPHFASESYATPALF